MTYRDEQWEESEWQEYVNKLLSIHHSHLDTLYTPIPDKTHGDGGLEGFSSNGWGYQCYADQDTESTIKRTDKQKRKIYSDLPKLKKYEEYWKKILQGIKLRFWVLVVPKIDDKAVLVYAGEQAEIVRKQNLDFVAGDFQATVMTDKEFPEAHARAVVSRIFRVKLKQPVVGSEEAKDFVAKSSHLIQTIDGKIDRMLPNEPDQIVETRNDLIDWYLRGANLLEQLRIDAPWMWEPMRDCIDIMARSLRTAGRFDSTPGRQRLLQAKDKLQHELAVIVDSALHSADLETVSWATVTQWLMECPLDFPRVRQ